MMASKSLTSKAATHPEIKIMKPSMGSKENDTGMNSYSKNQFYGGVCFSQMTRLLVRSSSGRTTMMTAEANIYGNQSSPMKWAVVLNLKKLKHRY